MSQDSINGAMKRGAAFYRYVKNIGVQEFENLHAQLSIAEFREPGYEDEAHCLAVQFFFGKSLGHGTEGVSE